MKLKVGQAYDLFMLMADQVDQATGTVRHGFANNPEIIVSGKARVANAVNMKLLEPHAAAFEKVRNERIKEIAPNFGEKNVTIHNAVMQKVLTAINELRDAECEIPLMTFKLEHLLLDENPKIGSFLLNDLAVLLEDMPKPDNTVPVLSVVQPDTPAEPVAAENGS